MVSEKQFCFGLTLSVLVCYFLLRIPDEEGGPGNPSAPIASMGNPLPTSGLDLPCAVPNFTP